MRESELTEFFRRTHRVCPKTQLGGRLGYFLFFSARGRGKGVRGAGREGGGRFALKIPGGGGGLQKGGGLQEGEGPRLGGCLREIWGGGGGVNIFFCGAEIPTKLARLSEFQAPPSYGSGRYGFGFSGPRIPFHATGALGDASRLFLDHFCKHLPSVLGRTELCHEVRIPRPQKPQIIRNENHYLALLESSLPFSETVLLKQYSARFLLSPLLDGPSLRGSLGVR